MKENKYPPINEKLITALMISFPDKLPDKKISEYELGYLIGQQTVIKHLAFIEKEQNGE